MNVASDMDLIRDYACEGSEPAFEALVTRHVDLVYSVAYRHVADAGKAEEITQAVFLILSRKAGQLRSGTILPAWLYETARFTSISFLRSERRRQFREQEAFMRSTLDNSIDNSDWERLAPLLDEALGRLGEKERAALVLRFFENKTANEIALALDVNEETAQKRVTRGLEKLRKIFLRRGVVTNAALIAAAISANSVQAAPVGLAATITTTAAKGAAVSGSTLTLVKGTIKFMAWTKAKITALTVVVVLLTPAAGILAVNTFHGMQAANIHQKTVSKKAIQIIVEDWAYKTAVSKSFPTLTADKVEAALKDTKPKDKLTLETATQIMREVGYAPGKAVGLDRSFYNRFGEHGATLFEAAAMAMGGQEENVRGIISLPELHQDTSLDGSPLRGEKSNLRDLTKQFGEKSAIANDKRALIALMEKDYRHRVFSVDPEVFLRNLEARSHDLLLPKSENTLGDTLGILLPLLQAAGVDQPATAFNRQAGSITMWNTPEALDAAARVILELNQPDPQHSVFLPRATAPVVIAHAKFFAMTDDQYDSLQLKGHTTRGEVGECSLLGIPRFEALNKRLRQLQLEPFSSPKVQTSSGVNTGLSVGDATRRIEFETVPYVRHEVVADTSERQECIDMIILAHSNGHFSKALVPDWTNAMSFTNVAAYAKVSMVKGSGAVLRARHPTASPTNNLVIVLTASVIKL